MKKNLIAGIVLLLAVMAIGVAGCKTGSRSSGMAPAQSPAQNGDAGSGTRQVNEGSGTR